MPEFKVYDGFWMMLGAAIAVMLVAPLVWRWPRERSLLVVVIAAVLGSIIPLAISAMTHGLPLMARLRGSWMLAGADMVGPAVGNRLHLSVAGAPGRSAREETVSAEVLATYLNDHLAGSVAALELVDRLTRLCRGTEREKIFRTLRTEIEEDQEVLKQLLRSTRRKGEQGAQGCGLADREDR